MPKYDFIDGEAQSSDDNPGASKLSPCRRDGGDTCEYDFGGEEAQSNAGEYNPGGGSRVHNSPMLTRSLRIKDYLRNSSSSSSRARRAEHRRCFSISSSSSSSSSNGSNSSRAQNVLTRSSSNTKTRTRLSINDSDNNSEAEQGITYKVHDLVTITPSTLQRQVKQ
jgi:hypothetical protein